MTALRLRLSQRGAAFFEPIETVARLAHDAAVLLADLCDRYPEQLGRADELHALERRGDEALLQLTRLVQTSMATPIDARDLVNLGSALYDVLDRVDDVGDDLTLYRPAALPEQARAQARVLTQAGERLVDAAVRLPRFPDLSDEREDVRALEREGDELRRDAVAKLFHSGLPPVEIVRVKAVHESLEEAIDSCRDAAHLMAMIAVKNRW